MRGYVADVQVIDEAAFVSANMILTGILPVGLNAHVATLLATTPGKQSAWFMRAIKLINPQTNKPIIPLLRTYMPCDFHLKTDTPWICTCKANKRADWKSPAREEIWRPLWFDRQETFAAENKGIEIDMNNSVFSTKWVNTFRSAQREVISSMQRFVYIAIDPAEGGQDEFAICAMAVVDTLWVVSLLSLIKRAFRRPNSVDRLQSHCLFLLGVSLMPMW